MNMKVVVIVVVTTTTTTAAAAMATIITMIIILMYHHIHPPTRADNPFNHYFATQEVTLGSNDRRMSAAVDGTHYNPYGFNQQLNAYPSGPAGIAGTQYLNNPNLGPLVNANRRSSVGITQLLSSTTTTTTSSRSVYCCCCCCCGSGILSSTS